MPELPIISPRKFQSGAVLNESEVSALRELKKLIPLIPSMEYWMGKALRRIIEGIEEVK